MLLGTDATTHGFSVVRVSATSALQQSLQEIMPARALFALPLTILGELLLHGVKHIRA